MKILTTITISIFFSLTIWVTAVALQFNCESYNADTTVCHTVIANSPIDVYMKDKVVIDNGTTIVNGASVSAWQMISNGVR